MRLDRSLRLGLVGFALVLAACGSAASASSAPSAAASTAPSAAPSAAASAGSVLATGALASVELHGGECVAAATCDTVITLDADGRIHLAAKPPNALGQTDPAKVQALQETIAATDFAALRKPAFSGSCPTAYDGQELVFEFTTAHGTERLASCESALDFNAPLFKALTAALGQASPIGATK